MNLLLAEAATFSGWTALIVVAVTFLVTILGLGVVGVAVESLDAKKDRDEHKKAFLEYAETVKKFCHTLDAQKAARAAQASNQPTPFMQITKHCSCGISFDLTLRSIDQHANKPEQLRCPNCTAIWWDAGI